MWKSVDWEQKTLQMTDISYWVNISSWTVLGECWKRGAAGIARHFIIIIISPLRSEDPGRQTAAGDWKLFIQFLPLFCLAALRVLKWPSSRISQNLALSVSQALSSFLHICCVASCCVEGYQCRGQAGPALTIVSYNRLCSPQLRSSSFLPDFLHTGQYLALRFLENEILRNWDS